MSQRTGNIIFWIIIILLNLWLMSDGSPTGRYQYDYYGDPQTEYNE